MDFSKIICIEVKKYNESQLVKISEALGFDAYPPSDEYFTLVNLNKVIERVYLIPGEPGPFALKCKKELGVKSQYPLYKDILFIYERYSGLSKKEKDRLLKIEPTDFSNKGLKKFLNKDLVEVPVDKVEKSVKNTVLVLELDTILDKIGKFGINSLLKEEKDFLDNLSKM
jgi:hypothetical protein